MSEFKSYYGEVLSSNGVITGSLMVTIRKGETAQSAYDMLIDYLNDNEALVNFKRID